MYFENIAFYIDSKRGRKGTKEWDRDYLVGTCTVRSYLEISLFHREEDKKKLEEFETLSCQRVVFNKF